MGMRSCKTALPDVCPTLPQGTFDGSTLVIKNTFIDMEPSGVEKPSLSRRAYSSPCLHSALSKDACLSMSLTDVRRRLFTVDLQGASQQEDAPTKSPRSCTASTCTPASASPPAPTTVLIKNLPCDYSRDMLVDTLNAKGFATLYDFLYSPMNFGTRANFGYAFINFISPEDADNFVLAFQHFSDWSVPSSQVADVDWSDRQGLEILVDRYRNSPLMHERVPDEAKPMLLENGIRVDFPPPTRPLKPLRVRQSKERKARTLGHDEMQEVCSKFQGD